MSRCFSILVLVLAMPSGVLAQKMISLDPHPGATRVTTPPSVDAGIGNGIAKHAGAPSVGDGRANGAVKDAGAPSVGDGVANGVVKSSTVNQ